MSMLNYRHCVLSRPLEHNVGLFMKKLLVLTLLSTTVSAHGHYPPRIDKYVTDSLYELQFQLSNHFEKQTCFDIEVNGSILSPMRTCLQAGQVKEMGVWVKSEPDIETQNIVCSIADSQQSVRTRMCSDAMTLFPATYLSRAQ